MDKVDIRFSEPNKPAAPNNLPKNAYERAVALVGLMGRLAVCIDRESEAIAKHRPVAEIKALVKEKEPMALVYEEISRLLRVDREGLAALPPELKQQLRDATERLRTAGQVNADTLRVAEKSQKILVETVASAVNRTKQGQAASYNATAAGGRAAPRGYGPPSGFIRAPSAALNTKL